MELIVVLLVAAVLFYGFYHFFLKEEIPTVPNDSTPIVKETTAEKLDVNKDGKVDVKDVKAVASKAKAKVKKAVDVNKDGKVNKADVVAAVKKVRTKKSKS